MTTSSSPDNQTRRLCMGQRLLCYHRTPQRTPMFCPRPYTCPIDRRIQERWYICLCGYAEAQQTLDCGQKLLLSYTCSATPKSYPISAPKITPCAKSKSSQDQGVPSTKVARNFKASSKKQETLLHAA